MTIGFPDASMSLAMLMVLGEASTSLTMPPTPFRHSSRSRCCLSATSLCFITIAEEATTALPSPAWPWANTRSPTWMSETAIGVAVFRSVCPGTARTMRAESAKVTDCSPLSVVKTTELPLTDLTAPTALTAGVCADAAQTVNTAATTIRVTLSFPSKYFMTIYYQLNHAAWRPRRKELSKAAKTNKAPIGQTKTGFTPQTQTRRELQELVFLCLSGELCLAGFQFQQGLLAFDSPAVTPHFSVRADNAMAWNGYCNWVGGASSGYGAHGGWPA